MNVDLLVMAAGMGSRFGGIKQLEPLGPHGEMLLDYAIYDAQRAGVKRVVFVVRRDLLADFQALVGSRYVAHLQVDYVLQELDDLPPGFSCPAERTKPWGTGHAIWCARQVMPRPFVAINADDYYGPQAMHGLVQALAQPATEVPQHHAMVAFRLAQTLSEFGSVSRGICEVDAEQRLRAVEEHLKISRQGARIFSEKDGATLELAGHTPVSLNCWGFRPALFSALGQLFVEFLSHSGSELKTEFYIPKVVDLLIARQVAKVDVLYSEDSWFGLTYPQDKAMARERLLVLIGQNVYPTPLWQWSGQNPSLGGDFP